MMLQMPAVNPLVKLSVGSPARSIRQRSKNLRIALLAVCLSAIPIAARADEETIPDHDARLDGYPSNVVLNAGGTATTYMFLFLLGILGLGCVFISGKRSHLD